MEIMIDYSSHSKCLRYLEKVRWSGTAICPYCSCNKSSSKDLRYTCLSCNRSYSVTVGTIFESSKLSLTKWFLGISLILSAKKGISSRQLARHLSVNKDTAWLLQKKIRQAMSEKDVVLQGIIEADESFVGGQRSNKHKEKRDFDNEFYGTGYQHKTPVLGMVERSGKVIAQVLNMARGQEIISKMKQWISPNSTIVTDGFGGYYHCSTHFASHQIINHSKQVYRVGDYHMNTIEGFWSMFKRSLTGQYHKISNTYIQYYLDEMAFKYNHRKLQDKGFDTLLKRLLKRALP